MALKADFVRAGRWNALADMPGGVDGEVVAQGRRAGVPPWPGLPIDPVTLLTQEPAELRFSVHELNTLEAVVWDAIDDAVPGVEESEPEIDARIATSFPFEHSDHVITSRDVVAIDIDFDRHAAGRIDQRLHVPD